MSAEIKSRRIIQMWPFFVFLGMGSSISFVYAGVKHKMRNLVLFGVGYGLGLAFAIAISEPTGGTAEEFSDTSAALILGIGIASTTHAFWTNKKHRSEASSEGRRPGEGRLEAAVPRLEETHAFWTNKKHRSEASSEGRRPGEGRLEYAVRRLEEIDAALEPAPRRPRPAAPPSPSHASGDSFESLSGGYFATPKELMLENAAGVSVVPVDVNSADLQTLLTRLNLSPADAERVLLARQATGGFGQIEEFVRTAGLKPHEFAKIRNLVMIRPIERENLVGPQREGRSGSGRILDI